MTHPTTDTWENPSIATARSAALAALALTAAQLQHGQELHAQAIVIDTYGFAASASADPARLLQTSQEQCWPLSLRQQSVDSSMTRMAEDAHQRRFFEEAWRAAGVTCVLRNSGEEGNRVDQLIERLAFNTYVTDRLEGFMQRATQAADIQTAKAHDKHCFIFTTNGVPLTGLNQDAFEELRFIRIFRLLGVRMMHLTYNRRNPLGDGCGESQDGGLSDLGRHAIEEMNRQGVLVDVAHSSIRTGLDAAACSTKPMLISHATCLALNPHCRAKSDELMKAVANTGGLMGIAAIGAFLGGQGNILSLLDHLEHAVQVMGIDHVAIGTDVATSLPPSPGDEKVPYKSVPLSSPQRLQSHWPQNDALFDPQWKQPAKVQTLAWTNWPLFTTGLVMRGYSDQDILKILGGNTLRVLASADA